MTPLDCAMSLSEELQKAFDDYVFEDGIKNSKINIKDGFLQKAITLKEKEAQCPAILIHPIEITDDDYDADSKVKLEISVITFSRDKEYGHRDLYHILQKIRSVIYKKQLLAMKYRLIGKTTTLIPPEQPYPQWWGVIEVTYTIARILEELEE